MERLHEVSELVDGTERIETRAVAGVRGEEGNRRIAPVVDQARRAVLRIELEYGEEFDRGDPEILKIRNLVDHAGVRPALVGHDAGARMPRETSDVHLVDHGGGERPTERGVALPVIGLGIDDDAAHGDLRVVARAARRQTVVLVRHDNGAPVGIEQHLGRIEAKPSRRVDGAGCAVRVDLCGAESGHESVPVVVAPVSRRIEADDARRLGVAYAVEEEKLDRAGLAREDAEVDAALHHGSAKREAPA
jgi:hypothetical protein